jgi:hypothetical protein
MQEFGSKYEAETLRNSKKMELVDVILYIYDSSDTNSFSYISNLRVCFILIFTSTGRLLTLQQQQYSLDHIPTLFVATKSDLDLAQQRHEVQPDVYCRRLFLQVPVAVSIKTAQTADVFATICRVALNPYVIITNLTRRCILKFLLIQNCVPSRWTRALAIRQHRYAKSSHDHCAFRKLWCGVFADVSDCSIEESAWFRTRFICLLGCLVGQVRRKGVIC